ATDENGQIMALKHRTLPIYGVQFHPESIMTPDGKIMLKNFIDTL
ncbi:MAG: anthranilate synthase component 2, partial [Nonlabens sp.]